MEAQKNLTLAGNIVLSVGVFGHSDNSVQITDEIKTMLDDIHRRKIDMSDGIYVINVNGYIGSSTKSEIDYAREHGKTVEFMFPEYCN